MGVYDDAARFAAEAEPVAVVARLLAQTPRQDLVLRGWLDPRTPPAPGGTGRVADLRAVLDDPAHPAAPWLLLIEMQARPDGKKLRATLDAVGNFASRASDGASYRVTSALVHLTGVPDEAEIDARLGDFGTRHRPLPWDVERDIAEEALARVESGGSSWGLLFWVALMRGAEQETFVARWTQAVERVADKRSRDDLAGIALIFAELAGCGRLWHRMLEDRKMTESAVVNGWISQGETKGTVQTTRRHLIRLLDTKFPGGTPSEVRRLIEEQDSEQLLETWHEAALGAAAYADFDAVLRQ